VRQWELRGVTLDVSDKRRQSEVPVRTEETIRILVDQLPAVFWTTDEELRFTSSLGTGLASLGLGPNQLVGISLPEFFEAEPKAPAIEAHRQALEGRSVGFELEWGGRSMRCRVAPLRDTRAVVIGTICVAMDHSVSIEDGDRELAAAG
jgi:PAS domain-containing protein